jgi:CheY-like chemotaxis protein
MMSNANRCCVLLVDDEPGVRQLIRRMLERAGLDVVEAGSGPEALAALEQGAVRIDLVLSDLIMPGQDGLELGRRIRLRWPALPVIYISANPLRAAALDGGDPQRVLVKPFTMVALVGFVRSHLERPAGPNH